MKFENDLNTEKTKSRISRWYVFAGTATAAFLGWGTLNTTGFCFSEMRYVPDQEFFARYLEAQGTFVHVELYQIKNWTNDPSIKSIETYKDGFDYLQKHPDCCSYGPQKGVTAESARSPQFYQRFLGSVWGLIAVHHHVKYVDGVGQTKEFQSFTQGWVDPCGYRVWTY